MGVIQLPITAHQHTHNKTTTDKSGKTFNGRTWYLSFPCLFSFPVFFITCCSALAVGWLAAVTRPVKLCLYMSTWCSCKKQYCQQQWIWIQERRCRKRRWRTVIFEFYCQHSWESQEFQTSSWGWKVTALTGCTQFATDVKFSSTARKPGTKKKKKHLSQNAKSQRPCSLGLPKLLPYAA